MEISTHFFNMHFTISIMLVCSKFRICHARDTITKDTPLYSNETIISAGNIFELGFFTGQVDDNRNGSFVGIWYYKLKPRTIVWVANRDEPNSLDSKQVVFIGEDNILHFTGKFTRRNFTRSSNTTAKLLDTGNLVLIDGQSGKIRWQSFKHPTDTFLPGMKMTAELELTSWIDLSRPGTGIYKFKLDEDENAYVIKKKDEVHWKSGEPSDTFSTTEMPPLISSLLSNSTLQTSDQNIKFSNRSAMYNKIKILNRTAMYNTTSSRLRLTSSGVLQFYQNVTNSIWREPLYPCSVYNACGTYGTCKNIDEQKKKCKCLEGFRPLDSEEWKSGQYTDGCRRKTEIACSRSSERDTFIHLNSVRVVQTNLRFGCDSEVNCSDHCLGDCQCQAYSFFRANGRIGSIDNARSGCWIWKRDLKDLQEIIDGGRSLWVRISVSDLNSPSQHNKTTADEPGPKNSSHIKQRILIISTTVIAIVICILSYLFYRRNNCSNRRARTSTGNSGSLQPMVFITESQAKNTSEGNIRKSIDVSFFKFQTILVATDNFSEANKLGEGGFGPVYLGTFGDEQYLAVKRLSSHSGQGVEEFQNEVALIAKLQHRNLVRVLGYCVEKDERVLLYEYMPNKSLDMFIFNQKQSFSLDWRKRFDIILGIARGLLYLHQDSRLRIIHRDLKTSNILLDDEINPKISDFGLARIVHGKETEANTNRVVGTYGYMAPEYALEGLFSIKTDVFSFGVIILEIISGKKNTGFRQSREALNLLGYAWKLWEAEKQLNLLDEALEGCCDEREVSKCVNIGLLCVQEDPGDRPTMADVVIMLSSESIPIPNPSQPAFSERRSLPSTSSSSSTYPKGVSSNNLTVTMQEGR